MKPAYDLREDSWAYKLDTWIAMEEANLRLLNISEETHPCEYSDAIHAYWRARDLWKEEVHKIRTENRPKSDEELAMEELRSL